jgi:hypothetical protein
MIPEAADIPATYVCVPDVARKSGLSVRRVQQWLADEGVTVGRTPLGYLWTAREAADLLRALAGRRRRGRPRKAPPTARLVE